LKAQTCYLILTRSLASLTYSSTALLVARLRRSSARLGLSLFRTRRATGLLADNDAIDRIGDEMRLHRINARAVGY